MSIISKYKEEHLKSENKRWEENLNGIKYLLTYPEENVRILTKKILTMAHQDRHCMFGGLSDGFGIKMDGYEEIPYNLCDLMDFIGFFVSHEILDDGNPGIGYYRSTIGEERGGDIFVLCTANDKDAAPYFCRSMEILSKRDPNAKYLTIERALEVLTWYEVQRKKNQEYWNKPREVEGNMKEWFEEMKGAYDLTEEEKEMELFVNEIIENMGKNEHDV